MNYPIKFYLTSGDRNPNENELLNKPLARLISECMERCDWFAEKTVEAKFWYPENETDGEFLLSISWEHEDKITEECPYSAEYHLCGIPVSEKDFKCTAVPENLKVEFQKSIAQFAEEVKYSMEIG